MSVAKCQITNQTSNMINRSECCGTLLIKTWQTTKLTEDESLVHARGVDLGPR